MDQDWMRLMPTPLPRGGVEPVGMSKDEKFEFMFHAILEMARRSKAIPYQDYLKVKFEISDDDIESMFTIVKPMIEGYASSGHRADYTAVQQGLLKTGMDLKKVDALICMFYADGGNEDFWEMLKGKPYYIEDRFKKIREDMRPKY